MDGLKTGHTQEAGYCLVTSSVRNGMRLIRIDDDEFVGGRYARETWEITRNEWRRLK